MKVFSVTLLTVSAVTSASAHVMVSPTVSMQGATQKYEVRVHNEANVAAAAVTVEIPDGVEVTEIADTPQGGHTVKKSGERITEITWQIDVQPKKYVALPFTAKNPEGASELRWSVRERLADGSVIDWSDKPGSKEKGSVTKLTSIASSSD
jgi:uncharacterized protein YcnI